MLGRAEMLDPTYTSITTPRSPQAHPMIPGEIFPASGDIELNAGRVSITLKVANSGDRPIQVGSHYHFAETNPALKFDRTKALGHLFDFERKRVLVRAAGKKTTEKH